jgi:hypothetical protein
MLHSRMVIRGPLMFTRPQLSVLNALSHFHHPHSKYLRASTHYFFPPNWAPFLMNQLYAQGVKINRKAQPIHCY